jgi:hypothetical protein
MKQSRLDISKLGRFVAALLSMMGESGIQRSARPITAINSAIFSR